MMLDVEINPGTNTRSSESEEESTPEEKNEERIDQTINESLKILQEKKDELDNEDIEEIAELLSSFQWSKKVKQIINRRVADEEKGKRKGGPGRGKTKEEQMKKEIDLAIEIIENNVEFLPEDIKIRILEIFFKLVLQFPTESISKRLEVQHEVIEM